MNAERLWDLNRLGALGDLARERGIGHAHNWKLYNDFPDPLVRLSGGDVYSREQVRRWQDERWPPGARFSSAVRRAPPPPADREPRPWNLGDLAAPGNLAVRYGTHKARLW